MFYRYHSLLILSLYVLSFVLPTAKISRLYISRLVIFILLFIYLRLTITLEFDNNPFVWFRQRTKETLASGNLLSVINVLMQLRKVCNHPNLFEVRPTVSPFQMEALEFVTASLVWAALDYDPLKVKKEMTKKKWDTTKSTPFSDVGVSNLILGKCQLSSDFLRTFDFAAHRSV